MLPTAATIDAATGCGVTLANRYAQPLRATCERFQITNSRRLAAFLAQVAHESGGLGRSLENLNYGAEGLAETWPSRFAVDPRAEKKVPNQAAKVLARKPEQIANRVYGGRMGNGAEFTGDGWRYRGRGLIQITGKANYEAITDALGRREGVPDFVLQPELLETPQWAAMSAGAFWDERELNALADANEFSKITTRINGGQTGAADRKARYARALRVFSQ